jgi:kynureninase
MRGYSEEQGLIILKSRPGEHCLRTADILSAIEEHGESIAVVFLCGVNYYTGYPFKSILFFILLLYTIYLHIRLANVLLGQRFDIEAITKCGQANGCIVGWDLAHSVGNVQLKLHEWNIDFACWCSYKVRICVLCSLLCSSISNVIFALE